MPRIGNDISKVLNKWVEQIPFHECWEWTGYRDPFGYGSVSYCHKMVRAHRFIYAHLIEKIPQDLPLDHVCNNRGCVNPRHLRPVSTRENTLRSLTGPSAVNARKTHCVNGHPFSGDNLYIRPSDGRRVCKTCNKAFDRQRKERTKLLRRNLA